MLILQESALTKSMREEAESVVIANNNTDFFKQFSQALKKETSAENDPDLPAVPEKFTSSSTTGILFDFTKSLQGLFYVEGVEVDKNSKRALRLTLEQEKNWAAFREFPKPLYELIINFSKKKLLQFLFKCGHHYVQDYANPWLVLNEQAKRHLRHRYFTLANALWPAFSKGLQLYEIKQDRLSVKTLLPVKVSNDRIDFRFIVSVEGNFIRITLAPKAEGILEKEKFILHSGMIFQKDDTLYLLSKKSDLDLLTLFETGSIKFPSDRKALIIKSVIVPLLSKYEVVLPGNFPVRIIGSSPAPRVRLSEFNDTFLMLKPQFQYESHVIDYDSDPITFHESENELLVIKRNKEEEKKLYEFLRPLHNKFTNQRNDQYYYLPFDDAMKGGWFLKMFHAIQENGYTIFGLEELHRFKYNTSKPKWEMKARGDMDWFDLKIKITWGDIVVPLKDVRKAIINRQNVVLLEDGSIGVIPDEWIRDYGMLLRMGEEKKDSIRINKRHLSVLQDISGHIDNKKIQEEIEEKRKRLMDMDKADVVPVSPAIKALLRPYQQTGFNWMQSLDELGWGGCLADDMGLGKTLQTICFLQYLKEKYPGKASLVITPTSLIYNWRAELDKFCPDMKYHVHYGIDRQIDSTHLENNDIILSTYGVMRNDAEDVKDLEWNYIILDESQTIKNPDSQTTRALYKLSSRNRLILSGTPVQNNTVDLFSQFNFLNPGLLGNTEFFKREFSTPIDKLGDKSRAEQLRKIIYPFILRRTKEQVATDLPDKTETVLWCEMGKDQRTVYDKYRDYYRTNLIRKIDEVGIQKAGIYVMEGLLRLRQICDHPMLLNDTEHAINESVKIEELMREIKENTGDHKILVFSQFTTMLDKIREALDDTELKYHMLDGSTAAGKRQEMVQTFQSDEDVKVFLISLKAGGVGLNLTAADYVYIVDPWWNPAAEQQAIDRTHRIGQKRKVFAYKMICKDSIEEKILKLQEIKSALANELISEDAAFVKKLTKEDVEFLLS